MIPREDFDKLIVRALELDEQGKERIDPVRARAIAREVGISESAWDAAVREWQSNRPETSLAPKMPFSVLRVALAGVSGSVGGAAIGLVSRLIDGGGDVATAGALIVIALGFSAYELFFRSARQAQAGLMGWWAGVTFGLIVGIDGIPEDVLTYTSLSWVGTSAAVAIADLWRRRVRPESPSRV